MKAPSPSPSLPLSTLRPQSATMRRATNVAVIGSGISGALCASLLARGGVSVTVFESGRGPGGRMSHRRETAGDGEELGFDHGAPYFTVREGEVMGVVGAWEARGLVAEWKERFGCLDVSTGGFSYGDKEDEAAKKYVGIPAMNSICKALCHEPGVEARFGITVGRMDWLQDRSSWSLSGLNGQDLGHFDGVVASDKNISSPRFASLTGRRPPLDILSRAFCDSSKPGRSHVSTNNSEKWVLHSTPEYAAGVITRTGLQKLSSDTLAMVADELLREFQTTKLEIPHPFYMKAHRWGSAFPATNIGGEEKCLWDKDKNLVICGDFCASPSVEGAVLSGIRAASKILEI